MRNTYYHYLEPRRSRIRSSVCYIGNLFALLGFIALVLIIIDSLFFNNNGLINVLIWTFERTY